MMWELIQSNKRKSFTIFFFMGICLLALGALIGFWVAPDGGGLFGVLVALLIWIIMSLVSFFSGGSIILAVSGAKQVTHDVHPQLFNVVEEMKIAANLPAMPKVYIIPDQAPNAFATGRNPRTSAIAVTAGLLSMLNRDELQGVIAHEMSHIANRDILYLTFAGMLLGSIVLISEVFLRSLWYSGSAGRFRSKSSSKNSGQLQLILMIVTVLLAILAPIFANLLYFSLSRKREYLADASAVRLTRYPEGLASALEKLSGAKMPLPSANRITAPMFIVTPLKKRGRKLSGLGSTHPPIRERIRILRKIAGSADLANYQQAYSRIIKGKTTTIIPPSGLKSGRNNPIRQPSVKVKRGKYTKKKDIREIGDLIRAVDKYAFLICACGLKLKIPPDFAGKTINCPKCHRELQLPLQELLAVTAGLGALTKENSLPDPVKDNQSQFYKRTGQGWESFNCSCGRMVQLSPSFSGTHISCPRCGRKTEIK